MPDVGAWDEIWCDACEAIRPLVVDVREADARHDQAYADLQCGECDHIIATVQRWRSTKNTMTNSIEDPVAAPEANYRRLSTAALVALRAELIVVHTQRQAPIPPAVLAEMKAAFPNIEIPEADSTPEAEPFFVARVACIDRILAERERRP